MNYGLIKDWGFNDITKDRVKLAEAGVQSDLIYIEGKKGINTLNEIYKKCRKKDYIYVPSINHLGDTIAQRQAVIDRLLESKIYVYALDMCIDTKKCATSNIFGISGSLDKFDQFRIKTQFKIEDRRLKGRSYGYHMRNKYRVYKEYVQGVEHLRKTPGEVTTKLSEKYGKSKRQIQRYIKTVREFEASSCVI